MAEPHREEIAKLEALHATNPEGRVFTHLAEAYRKAGELERSREILDRGLQRHGDYASAHVVLGRVLMDMGDTAGARASFRRVLELDRHNLIALRSLGELASGAGEAEEALRFYRELLGLDPGDDRVRSTVARLEREAETARAAAAESAAAEEAAASAIVTETVGALPEAEPEAAPPEPEAEPTFEPITFPVAESPAPPADAEPAGVSVNWEEDAALPQEAFPGDLAVFAGEEEVIAPGADFGESERFEADGESSAPTLAEAGATEFTTEDAEGTEGEWPGAARDLAEFAEEDAALLEPAAEYAEAGAGSDEVVTETLAELYAAQGLHERAADVYRALLRDRPEDERLSERLRESESLARRAEWSLPAPASEADIFAATAPDETEDSPSWLEGVESAWTGGAGVAGGGPTPYAWTDTAQAEDSGGGVRIADYFRDLLGWRPGQAEATAATSEEEPTLLLMDEVVEEAMPSRVEEPLPPLAEDTGQTPEEDEDLEMFRSWLQSLKK